MKSVKRVIADVIEYDAGDINGASPKDAADKIADAIIAALAREGLRVRPGRKADYLAGRGA